MTGISDIEKQYAERAQFFAQYGYDIKREREAVIAAGGHIKGDVLEVGTGPGHLTLALARRTARVTSVDIDQQKLEEAHAFLSFYGLQDRVRFVRADAGCLDLSSESFDFVFCANVIHHLADAFKVVDEMLRVSRPGGTIVISDFNAAGLRLIARIHQDQGRDHRPENVSIEDVRIYLERKGVPVGRQGTSIQAILIIQRPNQI